VLQSGLPPCVVASTARGRASSGLNTGPPESAKHAPPCAPDAVLALSARMNGRSAWNGAVVYRRVKLPHRKFRGTAVLRQAFASETEDGQQIALAQRRECAGRGQRRGGDARRDDGVRDRDDAQVRGVALVMAGAWLLYHRARNRRPRRRGGRGVRGEGDVELLALRCAVAGGEKSGPGGHRVGHERRDARLQGGPLELRRQVGRRLVPKGNHLRV
jgi:hypothetical protein